MRPGAGRAPVAGRRRLPILGASFAPRYVVWELTLLCDHACGHCGSRAARPRAGELTTQEALAVVPQLAAMGASEVVLIGGEAYLHAGFLAIVAALRGAGMVPVLVTGGRGVDAPLAKKMAAAGLARASVSIDGLAAAHDDIRARPGSFARALAALGHLRRAGLEVAANTTLSRVNQQDLEALYDVLRAAGVGAWQVQIMAPLGRAADRPEWLLQPYDLLDVVPRVAALKARGLAEGLLVMPGNNLGYFGPEEGLLRSPRAEAADHFQGCQAGRQVLGIESNGAVKGCPSLQSSVYVGGHLRARPLADIWRRAAPLAFARARTTKDLWGFCRTCPFAAPCLGGCTFTAHAWLGRPGNNPLCHFRARSHAARGLRERLVRRRPAPGLPFDGATFELVVEPADAAEPLAPSRLRTLL